MNKITKELDFLQNESDFFKNKLPDRFDCGLILIDLHEIKKIYCDLLDNLMETLKKTIYEKFCKLLMENEKLVNTILSSLDKIPTKIEEFINISKYINGDDFKSNLKKVKVDFKIIQSLQEIMNNYLISYEEILLQIYVESCIWIKSIKNKRNNTKNKLIEVRPKFKPVLDESKANLIEKFYNLKSEIEPFKDFNDYSNAFTYANSAKNIFTQLNTLVEQADTLNYQENFLNYQKTDFKGYLNIMAINIFIYIYIYIKISK